MGTLLGISVALILAYAGGIVTAVLVPPVFRWVARQFG